MGSFKFFVRLVGIPSNKNLKTLVSLESYFSSLGFGLGALLGIELSGPVSGGHLNPAVSAGLVAARKCPVLRGIFFIVAQCLGAIGKDS